MTGSRKYVIITLVLAIISIYLLLTVINGISLYETVRVKPILYLYTQGSGGVAVLFLNIMNPTNRLMTIYMHVYVGSPISSRFRAYPTAVFVPPKATISFPVMTIYFNSTHIHYLAYGLSGTSTGNYTISELVNMKVTVSMAIMKSFRSGYRIIRANLSIARVVPMSKPIGLVTYFPNTTWIDIWVLNPLPITIAISGYGMYSYNGSLLTSCMLSKLLIVSAGSTAEFDYIPTKTGPKLVYTNKPIVVLSTTCTANYTLPDNVAELPYGYVMLYTNMGNVTIPLLPLPLPP